MQRSFTLLPLAVLLAATPAAQAALSPTDMVGGWSAQRGCAGGSDFTYVMQGGEMQQIVRDGKREYRTPIKVQIEGGYVRVHLDEKVYTFRLQSKNSLQALKYTDSRTGLAAKLSPRTWFRCS